MLTPVITVLKNLTDTGKTISWASPSVYLDPDAVREIPGDICTMQGGRLPEVCQAVAAGRIAISLKVLQQDGSYVEIPVYPGAAKESAPAAAPVQRVEQVLVDQMQHDDANKHIIAATKNSQKMSEYYGAPAQKHEAPVADINVKPNTDRGYTKEEMQQPVSVFDEAPAEAPADETADSAEAPAVDDIGPRVDELIAAKKYDAVMELLVAAYGNRVTFTKRSVIALKTFAAIKAKYEL